MKPPILWCVQHPNGKLLVATLAHSKGDALFKLFDLMPQSFQKKYWKDLEGSTAGYKERGYRAIKVRVEPV